MTSNFAVHYIEHLVPLTRLQLPTQTRFTCDNDALKSTHATLQASLSEAAVQESVDLLHTFAAREGTGTPALHSDSEELAFYNAVVRKSIFNIYALAVDLYLQESSVAQFDAEWWADIERSTSSVAWYLLQSTSNLIVYCSTRVTSENSHSATDSPGQSLAVDSIEQYEYASSIVNFQPILNCKIILGHYTTPVQRIHCCIISISTRPGLSSDINIPFYCRKDHTTGLPPWPD